MTAVTKAPASRLDTYRNAALTYDAPLDTVLAYLRELRRADESALVSDDVHDPAIRASMARAALQMRLDEALHYLTTGISAEVRSAPPSWLAEVVRNSRVRCGNEACAQRVLPWEEEHCSDECRRMAIAAGAA